MDKLRIRRVLKSWTEWYRLATADDDNDYLNGAAWDDAEVLADNTLTLLRTLDATPASVGENGLGEDLVAALRPFADAWSVATHHPEVVSHLTMAQLGELAAHEVSGVHFRNAASVLSRVGR